MKECIARCFQKDGLLEVAKSDAAYQHAQQSIKSPDGETNVVVVPIEVENGEDIGAVEHEDDNTESEEKQEGDEEEQAYHIEVFPREELEDNDEKDAECDDDEQQFEPDSESEKEELAAVKQVKTTKRGRAIKPSSQVGSIKKSKYSKAEYKGRRK
jgi:hypothetical protein